MRSFAQGCLDDQEVQIAQVIMLWEWAGQPTLSDRTTQADHTGSVGPHKMITTHKVFLIAQCVLDHTN
ncbi:hypothetical protein HanHA300_Chr14g0511971 [Helianthus annuus]|nr:hypothetical protein HanHA300_Chr14g0511971 [Helianthus annuus]KAJ0484519.1 hypothetical protein HanHA89_Chr14g0545021 [Helianthus annuus]KAJ0655073.1 hypothetical protein HanLR1_Chr14g0514301 [Helianthus annuus]KAJ0658787.1 hypothetical protein HanOQP8_Chr14g0512141 [Helianthus annuus]